MHRRAVLAGVASSLAIASAGCSILGGGPSGPAGVAKAFLRAAHDGNLQRAKELTLPDSPLRSQIDNDVWAPPEGSISIESTETSELGEGIRVVHLEYTLRLDGETQQRRTNVQLERHEGNWRVYIAR